MTTNINLLPWREERRENNRKLFILSMGISAFVAVICVATIFLILEQHINFQTQRNQLIKDEIARYDRQIMKIKEIKSLKAALISRMSIIQELQQSRPKIVHFFDELVKMTPRSIYFLQVERNGDTVLLTGHADSNSTVSELMQNVQKNFWIHSPKLKEIEEVVSKKNNKLYNQFRLKAALKAKEQAQQGEFDE